MAQALKKRWDWIGWMFFTDLLDGLALTFSYMFTRTVTEHYPDRETWVPYPRYRGHHFLKKDDAGEIKCVGCELCAKVCPCFCITVVPYEDEKGNRRPLKFEIDTARCLFCGLCEDACPADAIALGRQYEFSAYDSRDLVVGRDQLLDKPGKTEKGGNVVAAHLSTEDGVRVDADATDGYHWWLRIRRN